MLSRWEEARSAPKEARSACAFVTYLSHGTFVRLEIWLRGHAPVNTD
jgi:hypothetical protein